MSSKIANTSLLACEYASNRPGTKIRSGHSFFAAHPPIADLTPNAFASYDAAVMTPPPTATGLP